MSKQLFEPITDSGIRDVNFFNGRLLTAQDLNDLLKANHQQHQQFGQGIGEGIIWGLETESAAGSTALRPILRVTIGLALNRKGEAVALSVPSVDVALARTTDVLPPEAGLFAECTPPTPSDNLSNIGVYVFTATPTSTYEGLVPVRNSISDSAFSGCGNRYAIEGIKFRLERIDFSVLPGISSATRAQLVTLLAANDAASISKLRNILAHLCFDREETTGVRRDPFQRLTGDAAYVNYGAVATLRTLGQITDCDVPLALVYWNRLGVQFVDNWAVRRLARRVLDLDLLSVLRSYGYERLLQFQRHLQDLESLGGLAAIGLQDYFQYLPPVGYFPVTGVKSPRGFHPTNFFKQFTTGSAGHITAERFGAILRESFACADVNLQTKPVFQLFDVSDNTRAVAASSVPSQLYQVFVSRSMNGPLARDGVARAFYDAWEVYRGLIKRRVFLPPGTDAEKIAAQLAITGAVRDVLDFANRQYAFAAQAALDTEAALDAFQEIYRVQNELATLFQSNIPGIVDTQERETFGQQISALLNNALVGGKPGLRPAVQAGNLPGAVDAQNAINLFVGNWSGEGVAVGPFGSSWQESPQGQNLVPGRVEPFPHRFLVNNFTDKRLTIQLEATVEAPHGDWSGSTSIENSDGVEVSSVDLAPGTTTVIVVKVKAPATAQVGDTATLTLSTRVPPPTNRTTQSSLPLHVASDVGGAVTSSVTYDGLVVMPATDPDNAAHNTTLTYRYNLRYTAPPGITAPAAFRLTVNLTSATVNDWAVKILDLSGATTGSAGVFRREFNLTPGNSSLVPVIIRTPVTTLPSDRTVSFTVRVESVSLTPPIAADHPQTFNIRVRANA